MAKRLSRKEIVAIVLILLSLFCLLNSFIIFYAFGPYKHHILCSLLILCFASGWIFMFFALCTWFCYSNYARARFHSRILCVTVLWILFALLLLTVILGLLDIVFGVYKIIDSMNVKPTLYIYLAFSIATFVAVVLFFVNIFLTMVIMRKYRRRHPKIPNKRRPSKRGSKRRRAEEQKAAKKAAKHAEKEKKLAKKTAKKLEKEKAKAKRRSK